ncbi:MAG: cation diffusion facilitator family transporter [Rhodospirillales bacterium]|nr:cation diffusion facilitator family transporter [Rhodospirillales bacterium]MCW8861979.1 cation diffusion facilitator family transporter [Rhodospirillales bacterium]MCW8951181.1 cation diffusion facilitator family transporter [Rhodospirillales bacterium]MCW8970574.1 cation diffusion facilitator family transporter [Rhodospirillales bacterium]MCW9003252.1 cation diffusion facilitator family transporter [Rhodospirillales bacterium]
MAGRGSAAADSARLMRMATYASVSVAGILIICKLVAWAMTDSISILSTLVDSMLDALASLVNLFAVRHALEPADKEHRFGHGKAEPLAGMAQAAFISGSAVFLILQAGERLARPQAIENPDVGYVVMGISIVLTLILVIYQRHVIRRTGSVAISADSLHYEADLLVNGSVVVSLLLVSQLGWVHADPLFAIAIAAYIIWGAWKIVRESLTHLMDRELPDEERGKIRSVVLAHPKVEGMHDLRTRMSGQDIFIQFHIEMDPEMPLREAHSIADEVMWAVEEAFPKADVLVHQDPVGLQEAPSPLVRP